jgi:glc operon protein GlcG
MKKIGVLTFAAAVGFAAVTVVHAQAPAYGPDINLDNAKKVAAAAAVEARKNKWNMVIAIVDTHGELVYLERFDNSQVASINIAQGKARTAARFKRPTKAFQDDLAGGGHGLRILNLEGAVAVQGGLPLVMDGKIVGAIGVSGATGDQDSIVATAGVAAAK